MANLIINKAPYLNESDLENVVNYDINPEKTHGLYGGQGVLLDNPYEYMQIVKDYYYQTSGKMAQHFFLSFDDDDCILTSEAYKLGYEICALLREYQMVFGVHKDTKHLHIHFCMNPLNVYTGRKFSFGFQESFGLRKQIGELLEPMNIICNLRMNHDYI